MKRMTCEMCGGIDLVKQDGLFVCQYCGTKYSVEEAKKMMIDGTVEVQGTVKIDNSNKIDNLYKLARRAKEDNDSINAQKYYEEIAVEEPESWEAQFYKVYYSCLNIKIAQIGSSCIRLSNCIDNVFGLITKNIPDEHTRKRAYLEIYNKIVIYRNLMINNINSSAENYSNASNGLEFMKKHGQDLCILVVKAGDAFAKVGMKNEALLLYKSNENEFNFYDSSLTLPIIERIKAIDPSYIPPAKKGCYVATAVYGSYDCPQVWTLRRYRDYTLSKTCFGRLFIHIYYAISPILVRWFGNKEWFKKMWRGPLDRFVRDLQKKGYNNTPYNDPKWK